MLESILDLSLFPSLMAKKTAAKAPPHIVVVGAGIIGASIAWHLAAQHGATVTIVATDIGGIATPNSFAWINANFGNPHFYHDFRRRSMAHWHELAEGHEAIPGLQNLIRWTTTIQWSGPADKLAADCEKYASWGYDVRGAKNAELAAHEPWLADAQLPETGWGLCIGGEGSVEAADAARLIIAHAQTAHGAKLLSAEVTRLLVDVSTGAVQGIVTASGDTIAADHVVLAAGLGTVPLAATAGVTVPVHGRPGLLVHSKPVTQRLLDGIVISNGPHMRQTVDGRILSGTDFAGTDTGTDPQARADALFSRVKTTFRPALGDTTLPDLELDYYTIGYRPDPEDGLPILGASGRAGLTLAVMHSGVTLAAIVGQSIADLIVDGKEDPDLASFALSRFDSAGSEECAGMELRRT
ncbi:fructosyl peptide oxidase [Grosmannia clavigera kw1407]|uniref:Fructosyl peptide oxidase n=1 Tax=Grosmannia clavigera (strain kw1407 / UAMH 11150) TaxID=655863 RepID=F0X7P5_GROCL|nr:fructosyl peptide oxidase [Grosmannia clavigera kw1407]EFX06387.1 fructosyl peptide oxidase [Grosmannia clavigera kw1407]